VGQKVAAKAKVAGGGYKGNDTHHEKPHDEGKDELKQFSGLTLGYGVHGVFMMVSGLGHFIGNSRLLPSG